MKYTTRVYTTPYSYYNLYYISALLSPSFTQIIHIIDNFLIHEACLILIIPVTLIICRKILINSTITVSANVPNKRNLSRDSLLKRTDYSASNVSYIFAHRARCILAPSNFSETHKNSQSNHRRVKANIHEKFPEAFEFPEPLHASSNFT